MAGAPVIITTALDNATYLVAYSDSIEATGTEPIVFTINSGSFPFALSMASSGVVSGLPVDIETKTVSITATNADGSDTKDVSITVYRAPYFVSADPTPLAYAFQGYAYTAACAAAGGSTPITYSVISGDLPDGLSLASDGSISGTPTTLGDASFTVRAENIVGYADHEYSIHVAAADIPEIDHVTPVTMPDGAILLSYFQTYYVNGLQPIVGTLTYGSLPSGVDFYLIPAGPGQPRPYIMIAGTPSGGSAGSYTFNIKLVNAIGDSLPEFHLTIRSVLIPSWNPAFTTPQPLTSAGHDVAYSLNLDSLSYVTGTRPLTFSLVDGDLPDGLTLESDGHISGTPTTIGTFLFTINVENSSGSPPDQQFSITVIDPPSWAYPIWPDVTELAEGGIGVAYSETLDAATGSGLSYYLPFGSVLPDGLTFNTSTRTISGLPTTGGTTVFGVAVSNVAGIIYRYFSIEIAQPPIFPFPGTTTTLNDGGIGLSYSDFVAATGSAPITYTVSGGTLPTGLSMATDGIISGTPSLAGTFVFLAHAVNAIGEDSHLFSITIGTPPSFTDPSAEITLPNGIISTGYVSSISATGDAPLSYDITDGSWPTGISLAGLTGVVSGIPTEDGEFSPTVRVSNSYGSASKIHHITIFSPPTYTYPSDPTQLSDGHRSTSYSESVAASGTSPITHTVTSGALPSGLSLSSSGVISGTPTTIESASFTVTATNYAGTASHGFLIDITGVPPAFVDGPGPVTLHNGEAGVRYLHTYFMTGDSPISVAVHSGSLPPGLTLSLGGRLTGYPTALGTYTFTVRATNPVATADEICELTIDLPDALEVETLPIDSTDRPTRIETDVQYAQLDPTDDARVEIWVCNNANDVEKSWEAINTDLKVHSFTNKRKEFSNPWACALKVRITRVGTSQVALYSYGFRWWAE